MDRNARLLRQGIRRIFRRNPYKGNMIFVPLRLPLIDIFQAANQQASPSKAKGCLFFSIGYIARLFRLNRIIAGFLGADSHCLPHIIAKDLAVTDIAGIGCLLNGINGLFLPFF